jgi:hypothetical protein
MAEQSKQATTMAGCLDRLSQTFTQDIAFCETLAKKESRNIARLFVYWRWAQGYINPIQEDLYAMTARHFAASHQRDAAAWTLSLIGIILKDLGLVPYLVVRGLISDAGLAVRRSLESAGVLAHLWEEPSKAECLTDPDSNGFRKAFIREHNHAKAAFLKAQHIGKRFAACSMGEPMTTLYALLSAYSVHGDSPKQLVTSRLVPTRFSCGFVNRPDLTDKDLSKDLVVLANGCEMLCIEVAFVRGTYGKKYGIPPSKGGEGGFYLTKLLDRAEMAKEVQATLGELGWLNTARS